MSATFDPLGAMSSMYLWLLFGFLSAMVNCDLQRLIKSSPLAAHCIGVTAFFFLFTLLDGSNKAPVSAIWVKTFVVYALFVMMTKSKWYFVVPVLVLLLLDQTLKKDLSFREAAGGVTDEERARQANISTAMTVAVMVLIVVGCLHYMHLQRVEYGRRFSLRKFFFDVPAKCKARAPVYDTRLDFFRARERP